MAAAIDYASPAAAREMTGRRFGRLTVTAYAGKRGGKHYWSCQCDCGGQLEVAQSNLVNGHTSSCGCIAAETLKGNLKLVDGTSVTILERGLGKTNAANKSGHTGVYFENRSGRWIAQIYFKGKRHYLGSFINKEDAVKAREAAEEMHQDFIESYYEAKGEPALLHKADRDNK